MSNSLRSAGFQRKSRSTRTSKELGFLLLSIFVQILLGLFFGHLYDMRIFMATGYLVGTGQNPYIAQDLSAVFNNLSFQGITTIGYPPPWALLLGFIYRVVYASTNNFLLYNLAIKIPIIAANVCLAYLVGDVLNKIGIKSKIVQRAWIFMLFNPLLFYFASAWGQIDSVVALFALLSLIFLNEERLKGSAVFLALAISLKPIALPILPVVLIFLWGRSHRQALSYFIVMLLCLFLFCVAPFFVFGWDPSPILQNWNAHFMMVGGMSLLTFFELFYDSYRLPGWWWLLGMIWIPAMGIGIYLLKSGVHGFIDLLKKSLGLIFIFFLTRAWLSEPNVILILPLALILVSAGELDRRYLTAIWVITLIFTLFNGSLPQLLFPSLPSLMNQLLRLPGGYRAVGLMARSIMAIPWQIVGWKTVVICFNERK